MQGNAFVRDDGCGGEVELLPVPAVLRAEVGGPRGQLPDVVVHPQHRPATAEHVVQECQRHRLVVRRADVDDTGVGGHLAGRVFADRLHHVRAAMGNQVRGVDRVRLPQPAPLSGAVIKNQCLLRRTGARGRAAGRGGRGRRRSGHLSLPSAESGRMNGQPRLVRPLGDGICSGRLYRSWAGWGRQ